MAKKTGLGKGLDALFSDNSYKKMDNNYKYFGGDRFG